MKKILSFVAIAAIALSFAACNESDYLNPETDARIEGVFSVGRDSKVHFAKGNLQRMAGGFQQSVSPWLFATHQYDTIGRAQSMLSDLFTWDFLNDGDKYLKDWHISNIRNDQEGHTWRVLTAGEWLYLLRERPGAELLFGLGSINGINGVFILPDKYWDKPAKVLFTPSTLYPESDDNGPLKWNEEKQYYLIDDKPNGQDEKANGFAHNVFSLKEWELLEYAGVIFLPASGTVTVGRLDRLVSVNEVGGYWSCTLVETANNACALAFLKYGLNPINDQISRTGQMGAVRLVRDVEPEPEPVSPIDLAKKEMVEWGYIMMEIQTWLSGQDADESVIQSFNAPMTTVHDVNRDPNATMEQVEAAIKTAKEVCKDYAADYFPVWKEMKLSELDGLIEDLPTDDVQRIVNEAKQQVNALVWDDNKNHEQIYDLRVQIDQIVAKARIDIDNLNKQS